MPRVPTNVRAPRAPRVPRERIREPRWPTNHLLVLIEAKRIEVETCAGLQGRDRVKIADVKWQEIQAHCEAQGIIRNAEQCRRKWEKMQGEFKKIFDYLKMVPSGQGAYFEMNSNEKKERCLPLNFPEELYNAMLVWFPQHRAVNPLVGQILDSSQLRGRGPFSSSPRAGHSSPSGSPSTFSPGAGPSSPGTGAGPSSGAPYSSQWQVPSSMSQFQGSPQHPIVIPDSIAPQGSGGSTAQQEDSGDYEIHDLTDDATGDSSMPPTPTELPPATTPDSGTSEPIHPPLDPTPSDTTDTGAHGHVRGHVRRSRSAKSIAIEEHLLRFTESFSNESARRDQADQSFLSLDERKHAKTVALMKELAEKEAEQAKQLAKEMADSICYFANSMASSICFFDEEVSRKL